MLQCNPLFLWDKSKYVLWQSTLCHKCCQLSLRLNWTRNIPLTTYHFDTNLKYRGENGSLFPLKGETERKGEKNHLLSPCMSVSSVVQNFSRKCELIRQLLCPCQSYDIMTETGVSPARPSDQFNRFWTTSLLIPFGQNQLCKSNSMSHILWIPLKPWLDNRYMANVFLI